MLHVYKETEPSPQIRVLNSAIGYVYVYTLCVLQCSLLLIFRRGELEMVKYLIEEQRCSVGCTDNQGRTVLHHACQ